MSVDTFAAASDSALTSQFIHRTPSTNDWVQDRKQSRFYPSGSATYSPTNGTKLVKINVSGEGWLDPYSCHLMMTVTNKDGANAMTMTNAAYSAFDRCRVFCNGVQIEDIAFYGRNYYMLNKLGPKDHMNDLSVTAGKPGETINANASQTFSFPMWTGLLSQHKALPMRYLNMSIELEVVSDSTEFGDKDWELSNVFLIADTMTLDTALQSSYAAHLLQEGKELTIPFSGYMCSNYSVTDSDWQVNLSRSVSRMKAIFLTFKKYNEKKSISLQFPGTADNFEVQAQLGAKLFPETKMTSRAEMWPRLLAAAGNHTSVLATTAIDIGNNAYAAGEFIVGISTQKVLSDTAETNLSGVSSKSGDQLTIRTSGVASGPPAANYVNEAFVCIQFDNLLVISDEGVRNFN